MKQLKPVNVIRLHREDLEGYIKNWKDITQEQLEGIGTRVADGIMNSGVFWECIENIAPDYEEIPQCDVCSKELYKDGCNDWVCEDDDLHNKEEVK